MSRQNLTPVNIPAYPANPNTPTPRAGDMYFNTAASAMYYYTGTAWTQFAAGGASSVAVSNYNWWDD